MYLVCVCVHLDLVKCAIIRDNVFVFAQELTKLMYIMRQFVRSIQNSDFNYETFKYFC